MRGRPMGARWRTRGWMRGRAEGTRRTRQRPGTARWAEAGAPDAAVDLAADAGAGDATDARVGETFLLGISIRRGSYGSIRPRVPRRRFGPLSLSNVFMVSFDPTRGKLFGIRESFSSPLLELATVDPCTGAATTVGPLHVATGTLNFVEGFAVNPASGVLYITGSLAHHLPDSASEALLTVDPTTALATFVANTDSPSGDIDNLLFVGDTLYATDVEGPTSNQTFLYKMNPATAAVAAAGTPSDPTQVYQLAVDARTGAAYASDLKPAVHFGTVNLANNTHQSIAGLPGLGSIAFVTAACR